VVLAYLDDAPDVVTMSMNGWGNGHPAWWLNLRANPNATLELPGEEPYAVVAHAAEGAEHDRLWAAWKLVDKQLDEYVALRTTETPLVVLQRRDSAAVQGTSEGAI
ncbi:MAG: nitroreductase/quinone reductase family protein, partial [Thermomicrobiales bacterium]